MNGAEDTTPHNTSEKKSQRRNFSRKKIYEIMSWNRNQRREQAERMPSAHHPVMYYFLQGVPTKQRTHTTGKQNIPKKRKKYYADVIGLIRRTIAASRTDRAGGINNCGGGNTFFSWNITSAGYSMKG
ncbi:MAG TPA: hypothetical protein O0Y06_09965 [Methanocorpusculum sp.]|nr:hypothetical protein [Methanocorpusculum sp.]HJK81207.1 hypothetical protein [Methanocorpusculum sp.]